MIEPNRKVMVLGTGGTIAGEANGLSRLAVAVGARCVRDQNGRSGHATTRPVKASTA